MRGCPVIPEGLGHYLTWPMWTTGQSMHNSHRPRAPPPRLNAHTISSAALSVGMPSDVLPAINEVRCMTAPNSGRRRSVRFIEGYGDDGPRVMRSAQSKRQRPKLQNPKKALGLDLGATSRYRSPMQ